MADHEHYQTTNYSNERKILPEGIKTTCGLPLQAADYRKFDVKMGTIMDNILHDNATLYTHIMRQDGFITNVP